MLTGSACRPRSGEDLRLQVRGQVAVGADRPGDLAHRHVVEGAGQALPVAGDLERPAGDLEAQRRRLGVDRVRPAHHHGARLRPGPGDQGGEERVDAAEDEPARRLQLEGETGVHDVAARQAEMEVAALGADRLGDLAHERDDVVLGRLLDLGDPVRIHPCPGLDRGERVGRDEAAGGLGPGDGDLHTEHRPEAGVVVPQGSPSRGACTGGSRPRPGRRCGDVAPELEAGERQPVGGGLGSGSGRRPRPHSDQHSQGPAR